MKMTTDMGVLEGTPEELAAYQRGIAAGPVAPAAAPAPVVATPAPSAPVAPVPPSKRKVLPVSPKQGAVLQVLQDYGTPLRAADIAQLMGTTTDIVSGRLNGLKFHGKVEQVPGHRWWWRLAPAVQGMLFDPCLPETGRYANV